MTSKRIKIKAGTQYDYAELILLGREIIFKYNSYTIKAEGEYPFMVLKKIREELERESIMLMVNGSRRDVYPSGLSLVGDNAYVQAFGKATSLDNLVNIFEETDKIELLGTVEEQTRYHWDWIKSLR